MMNEMIENEHFRFLNYNENITAIEILKGPYKDVIYQYGKVRLDHEQTPPKLTFDYNIIDLSVFQDHELESNEEFHTLMGNVLVSILMLQLGEVDGSYREDNTKKYN